VNEKSKETRGVGSVTLLTCTKVRVEIQWPSDAVDIGMNKVFAEITNTTGELLEDVECMDQGYTAGDFEVWGRISV
jgi:hypothetical protein